jgi:predicted metal-dependent peptidase
MIDNASLTKTFKEIIWSDPFYGIFLTMLDKKWEQIPTIGTYKRGLSFELNINPEYFNSLSPEQKRFVILHELIHMCLMHPLQYKRYEYKFIALLAMDIVVNNCLKDYEKPTIPIPITHQFVENLVGAEVEERNDVKYYYDILAEILTNDEAKEKLVNDDAALGNEGGGFDTGSYHDWHEFEEMSEAEEKLVTHITSELLVQTRAHITKSRGSIPGELGSIFEIIDQEEPPKFNWRKYLRMFSGHHVTVDVKSTRMKENYRFPDAAGMYQKQKCKILVAIDTSGSVSSEELQEFFNELKHISKTDVSFMIMQCDAKAYEPEPFDPKEDYVRLKGRGGTSFDPPVQYYVDNLHEYQALIYFTDGECSAPKQSPPNILWVLSGTSVFNASLPGKVIRLEL